MKKYLLTSVGLFVLLIVLQAQQPVSRVNQFADLTGTIGSSQGTVAASYVYNWKLGKKKKWEAGLGLRYTGYFGNNKDFITAPAKLARTTTIPFAVVFAGQKTVNWDTLTVHSPLANAINLSVNAAYNFNNKWCVGANIDLIGFAFGRTSTAVLTSNGVAKTEPSAKPASFNLLLTGDNDYGNLNSEFFLRYKLDEHWAVKAVYGFYFAEYKTKTIVQTAPDGTLVDRFRNKVNLLGLGVSYHF